MAGFVTTEANSAVPPDSWPLVQAARRAALAGFKRPKYVVLTDALPKNPSGKVLKRELSETYFHLAEEAR